MLQFIDTHIHLQDFKDDFALFVVNMNMAKRLLLVATKESDYEKIALLMQKYQEKISGAFGVHPWYSREKYNIEILREYLKKYPKALVGEIGVDEIREPVYEEQHVLFDEQLSVAMEFSRPVVVHAAKAYMALTEHKKKLMNVKFVHHGFVKNRELLKFINSCGGYIGIGELFLRQKNARDMWKMMPIDRVLFETDAPYRVDENKYAEIVKNNIIKLADIAGEKSEDLAVKLIKNAEEFLKC